MAAETSAKAARENRQRNRIGMSIMTRRAVVERSTGEGIGHTNARRVEIEGPSVGFAGDTLGLLEG